MAFRPFNAAKHARDELGRFAPNGEGVAVQRFRQGGISRMRTAGRPPIQRIEKTGRHQPEAVAHQRMTAISATYMRRGFPRPRGRGMPRAVTKRDAFGNPYVVRGPRIYFKENGWRSGFGSSTRPVNLAGMKPELHSTGKRKVAQKVPTRATAYPGRHRQRA